MKFNKKMLFHSHLLDTRLITASLPSHLQHTLMEKLLNRQKERVDWLISELTLNGVEVYLIQGGDKEKRNREVLTD